MYWSAHLLPEPVEVASVDVSVVVGRLLRLPPKFSLVDQPWSMEVKRVSGKKVVVSIIMSSTNEGVKRVRLRLLSLLPLVACPDDLGVVVARSGALVSLMLLLPPCCLKRSTSLWA